MKKQFTMKEVSRFIARKIADTDGMRFDDIAENINCEFSGLPESIERMATRVIQQLIRGRSGLPKIKSTGRYKFRKTYRGVYAITPAGMFWLADAKTKNNEMPNACTDADLARARTAFFTQRPVALGMLYA